MNSYAHPSALGPGEVPLLQNGRLDTRCPSLRAPLTAHSGTAPSGTFVSGALFPTGADGEVLKLAAMNDGAGAVRIYGNVWNGSSWSGEQEISEASGKYGNTRFGTTGQTVTFAAVPKPGLGVDIIVQDGVGNPKRIPSNNSLAGDVMANIQAITAPKQLSQYAPQYGPKDTITCETAHTNTTLGRTGTTFDNAATNYLDITVAASPTLGETVYFYHSSSTLDLTNSKQVWILAKPSSPYWLNSVKIELYAHTGPVVKTIHDPASDQHIEIQTASSGLVLYAFPIEDTATSAWEGLRFTVTNAAGLVTGDTFKIYGIATGGKVPCLAEYLQCWHNTASNTDSPGVVLKTVTGADKSTVVRGSNVTNPDGTVTATSVYVRAGSVTVGGWTGVRSDCPTDFSLPLDTRLYCNVTVPMFSPNSTDGGRGVDYIKFYRRDPGETDFTFVNEQQCAQYTAGNWTYYTPFTAWDQQQSFTDNVAAEDKVLYDHGPDAFTQPVPIGLAMCSADKRLYVGTSQQSSSSVPYSSIKASEADAPFRFRSVTRFLQGQPDPDSGFEARLPVGESARSILASASSLVGHSGVYVWTDRSMYLLQYLSINRVGSSGAVGAFAATEHGGSIFWLDPERVLRRAGATVGQISRTDFHDKFTALTGTNAKKVTMAYWRDRLYVTLNGTSKAGVWSALTGKWESLDSYNASAPVPVQFALFRDGATDLLVFFDSTGRLYKYEDTSATQDAASYDIPFEVDFAELSQGDNIFLGPAKVYSTANTGKTLTATWNQPKQGATSTATAVLSVQSGEARVMVTPTSSSSLSGVGKSDTSMQLKVSGSFVYPWSLLRVSVQTQADRGRGGKA